MRSELPEHETKLPSSKKAVKYRPFLVKEEKILLIAKQGKDKKEQLTAIENIILSCCDIKNINTLPLVDVEHLFLELRKKSIGEVVNLTFSCPHTREKISVKLDLGDIKLNSSKNKKKIELSPTKSIELKDYSFGDFKKSFGTIQSTFDEIGFLISKLETPVESIDCKSLTKNQRVELVDNLLPSEYKNILKESNKISRYEHVLTYNVSSGEDKTLRIKGLFDFFCLPSAI